MEKTDKRVPPSAKKGKQQKPLNSFFKYSNLAIQMVVTIGLLGFIGFKIDEWLNLKYPIFLIIFIFIALIGLIYKLIKSLNAEN